MNIEFLHYWPLVGVLGLGFIAWWHHRSLALFSPRRKRVSLILRSLIYLLVVVALAEPQWIGRRQEQFVYWLVDASRSVGGEARKIAEHHAAETLKTGLVSKSGFIAFGGKPLLVKEGSPFPEGAAVQDDSSDLAAALNFAAASFPPGYAKTVVLVSDGQETRGEVLCEVERLRDSGVRIHTVLAEPPKRPEVLVRSVTAPQQVNEDEPFKLIAEVVSNRDTEATVEVFRNGPRIASKELKLHAGVNRFETSQSVSGERAYEFAVSVKAAEDTITDNNQATALVLSAGKSKALLLADKPDYARYLARALKQEGVLLDVRPATGAPVEMGDLQNYDLLLLDNVPATSLTPGQMQLFASYVKDFGGGLLMLGGEQSFGLGGYYRTAVEEVLPVRCDFEKEQDDPALGLVLVIDRSGSMSGDKIEMAKDAAKAAVELLSPKDYVGVVAFDHEAFWVSEIALASDKGAVIQKIASIEANGGTNMAPAMEMAISRLQSTPAKLKHILMLTDGMSTEGPFYELATQAAQNKMTLSTVGLGGDTDQELLKKIAEWGSGRFYFTDNAQSIPQIFAKETMTASKSALQEMPFLPVKTRSVDFLKGIDFEKAPFLLGYVTTKIKPTAEAWLLTEKGEPLLATWRYGLGQVGAFTSDARNRWAVEWLKWDGYGKFWVQTTRKLMRSGMLKHFPAQLVRQGESFHLSFDCLDSQGHYLSDLSGEVLLLHPEGRSEKLPLQSVGPGKFITHWPASRGAYHAQVALRRGEEVIDRQYLTASVGYPDEYLLRPVDEVKLRAIAKETGGLFAPQADAVLNDRSAPVERELWPWLAGLALFFFIADVAVKRWPGGGQAAAQ